MENDKERIGRFDFVKLKTTTRVSYLSAPEGELLDPRGTWMVAGIIGEDLLLTKNSIVIRIHMGDVIKVLDYHQTFNNILHNLGRFNDYEVRQERTGDEVITRSDQED